MAFRRSGVRTPSAPPSFRSGGPEQDSWVLSKTSGSNKLRWRPCLKALLFLILFLILILVSCWVFLSREEDTKAHTTILTACIHPAAGFIFGSSENAVR